MEIYTMAVKTKGTELWLIRPDSAGYDVIKVGCPTGITGLGGAKSQIETTCLDSDEQEFEAGFAQPGQVTVNLDFDPAKISHQELWDLSESGDKVKWAIGLSDGATSIVPTVDSAGTITFPNTRTFIEFDGYVSDLPIDAALNSVLKSTMQIQRSGARILHRKTA